MVFWFFCMYCMENVSIFFVDIVGFIKMLFNKLVEQLVNFFNDFFGCFDCLIDINNCEKISILGDCYYCVVGCLEVIVYYVFNCVEMGLDMLE